MLLQAQKDAEEDLDYCLALLTDTEDPSSIVVWNNFDYKSNDALEALKARVS
jgi:hypothetical protein